MPRAAPPRFDGACGISSFSVVLSHVSCAPLPVTSPAFGCHTRLVDVTLGLVVPDYRVREFKSLSSIRELAAPRIGFVDLSSGFISRLKAALPDAQFIEIRKNGEYFTNTELELDALLISAESGSAFTLLYPDHEVAIPEDLEVKLPLFYAITGRDDSETRSFLNHWIELRQKDGTFREYYEHWILGKSRRNLEPRWSVIRNVLHWVH